MNSSVRRFGVIAALASLVILSFMWSWVFVACVFGLAGFGATVCGAFVLDWISRADEDLDAERRRQNAAKARQ